MSQPPYGEPPQPHSPGPYPGRPYPGGPADPDPGQQYPYPPPVDPYSTGQPYPPPAQPYSPAQPGQAYQPYPPGQPGPQYPATGYGYQPAPPKKRRGLLITAIVLGLALLLCGGGGTAAYFLLVRNGDGQGAENPGVAVNDFLVAVYSEGDVTKAGALVCAEARDRDDLTKKIDEVKQYGQKYKEPKFSWEAPKVGETTSDRATVDVTVKITTSDEKVAEQPLRFTVIKKTGWFVCEVQSGG
jgi:flagellar basal body-associated protein FliL